MTPNRAGADKSRLKRMIYEKELRKLLEAAAGADEGRAMTWANCTHVWWCWPL